MCVHSPAFSAGTDKEKQMTDRVYPVQTRSTDESSDWALTGERASIKAVRLFNSFHGWEKARLVTPEAEKLRMNMRALAEMAHD